MRDFKEKLKAEGKSFAGLRRMTSRERIKEFEAFNSYEGDKTAEWINKEYERKMLLPNQKEALLGWADRMKKNGLGARGFKLLHDKIAGMKDVFSPKESKPFLEGLAKARLGFEATREDAKAIASAAQTAQALKKELDRIAGKDWNNVSQAEMNGMDEAAMDKSLEMGRQVAKLEDLMKEVYLKQAPPSLLAKIAGTMTTLRASWDASFGRQLLKSYYATAFDKRFDGMRKGWAQGMKALLSGEKAEAARAAMYGHPYYLSGKLDAIGVRLGGQAGEFFPESFLTDEWGKKHLGAIGRMFEASERGMEIGILWRKFEMGVALIDANDGNLEVLKAQEIGKAIDGLVGKVDIPLLSKDQQGKLGAVFFAPRWVASQVRNLVDLRFNLAAPFVKLNDAQRLRLKAANINIISTAVISSVITAAVRAALGGDDDEGFWESLLEVLDPRSSDFGKIRIGDVRLDLSVGTNAIITTLARVATGKTKGAGGLVGDKNRGEAIYNFLKYKESPALRFAQDAAAVIKAQFTGEAAKDIVGQEMPAWKFITDSLLPISAQNLLGAAADLAGEPDKRTAAFVAGTVASMIADLIGINSSFYDAAGKPMNMGKDEKTIREELRVARKNWTEGGSNARPPSVELRANTKIMSELKPEAAARAQREFREKFLQREKALFESGKYRRATFARKMEMIKKTREDAYQEVKKKYLPKKPKKGAKK
jgi:hypothetical protein